MDLRIKDLDLRIEGTPLEARVERLYAELEKRGIRFKPMSGCPASGSRRTECPESRYRSVWPIPD